MSAVSSDTQQEDRKVGGTTSCTCATSDSSTVMRGGRPINGPSIQRGMGQNSTPHGGRVENTPVGPGRCVELWAVPKKRPLKKTQTPLESKSVG